MKDTVTSLVLTVAAMVGEGADFGNGLAMSNCEASALEMASTPESFVIAHRSAVDLP